MSISNAPNLGAALDALADAAAALRFDLAGPTQPADRALRDRTVQVVRRYLMPRLVSGDAPVTVAVVGPTGGGKSTLVNSLAGAVISPAGVLRPTTGRPVVWRHRDSPQLPDLEDLSVDTRLDDHPLLRGLTVVDTPDIDSQVSGHRRIAEAVVDRADLAMFVTTPQRYADAAPWEMLERLRRRGMALMVVLNRMSRRTQAVRSDLARLLDRAGVVPLGGIVEIQEQRLQGDERLLPRPSLRRLASLLEGVARDRREFVDAAFAATLEEVVAGGRRLLAALEQHQATSEELVSIVAKVHEAHLEDLVLDLEGADLVRPEAVGHGTSVQMGSASDVGAVRWPEELVRAVAARLAAARRATEAAWSRHPGGDELVPVPGVGTAEVRRAVDVWLDDLADVADRSRRWTRSSVERSAFVALTEPGGTDRRGRSARARLVAVVGELFERQRDGIVAVALARRDPPARTVALRQAVSVVEERRRAGSV